MINGLAWRSPQPERLIMKLKTFTVGLTVAFLFAGAPAAAHGVPEDTSPPESDREVLGGWSEDGDTWFSPRHPLPEEDLKDDILPMMAPNRSNAPRHTGKAEERVIRGTTHKRTVGTTVWPGVRHYTRAQLVDGTTVRADSGRVWGKDRTTARSGWVPFNPHRYWGRAKTFYGR